MSSFFRKPQPVFWRKAVFQVHLWSGILAALYVALIGLTGSILVFREEAEAAMESHLRHASNPEGKRADLIVIAERLAQENPRQVVLGVYAAESPEHSVVAYLRERGNPRAKSEALYFHPGTGAFLGKGGNASRFWTWLGDLHFNLLAGRPGRIVNGVGAAFLLALCLTGIVIWWPGILRWKRSVRVDFERSWKRVNWDLHSATGFWTVSVLAMWALTGIYFAWPEAIRAAVNSVLPVSMVRNPKSGPPVEGEVRLRELLESARARSPRASFYRLNLPADESAPIRIYLSRRGFADVNQADVYYFDQYTGQHLMTLRRGLNQSAGDVVMAWIGPLHFGTFGGVPVKVLWVVLGLAPVVLSVTGVFMYWNRSLSKKWRKLRTDSAERGKLAAGEVSVARAASN
jgi:uncharacterized iron-regulated membrane protein